MNFTKKFCRSTGMMLALVIVMDLTGCAHLSGDATVQEKDILKKQLTALAATVREDDAQQVAVCAYDYSRQLGREYHVVRPAVFQNFLVNIGIKNRGLCYQWTEDLLARLQTLNVTTLQLRWGMARAGTVREHNSVVVTALGQPFEQGIVLDPWRHSGRLVWKHVAEDKYPWVEGELAPSSDASVQIVTPK